MTSDVPYVVAIAGFAILLVLGALTTASSFVFSTLGWLRPYAWRVWLWGSAGYVASNALLFALLYRALTHVSVSEVQTPNRNAADVVVDFAVNFGPLIVSALGVVVGSILGMYLARRRLCGAFADDAEASP
jgi:hypothetical protein